MLPTPTESRKGFNGAEGSDISVVNILLEGKMATSELHLTGRMEETLPNESHKDVLVRGAQTSLRCLVEILLWGHELTAEEMFTKLSSMISMKIMIQP